MKLCHQVDHLCKSEIKEVLKPILKVLLELLTFIRDYHVKFYQMLQIYLKRHLSHQQSDFHQTQFVFHEY